MPIVIHALNDFTIIDCFDTTHYSRSRIDRFQLTTIRYHVFLKSLCHRSLILDLVSKFDHGNRIDCGVYYPRQVMGWNATTLGMIHDA
jgi:hypothetical protein